MQGGVLVQSPPIFGFLHTTSYRRRRARRAHGSAGASPSQFTLPAGRRGRLGRRGWTLIESVRIWSSGASQGSPSMWTASGMLERMVICGELAALDAGVGGAVLAEAFVDFPDEAARRPSGGARR